MNRPTFAAVALSALMAVTFAIPANALPMTAAPAKASSQIEQVQAKIVIKTKNWRGHRGYRERRSGYRRHTDGYWYPRAAFTVRVAPGVRVRVGATQARWCRERYRSYRISDNTYVTARGNRVVCRIR
ncbi:BA14K family protein [Rhizobium sp.]